MFTFMLSSQDPACTHVLVGLNIPGTRFIPDILTVAHLGSSEGFPVCPAAGPCQRSLLTCSSWPPWPWGTTHRLRHGDQVNAQLENLPTWLSFDV